MEAPQLPHCPTTKARQAIHINSTITKVHCTLQLWSAISVWFYSALDTRHLKLLAPCHPLKRRPKLSLSRRQSLREVLPTRDESPYRISSEESFQGKKTVSLKLSEHTCIITLSKYILQHQQGHMTSIRGLPAERSQNL